MCTPADVGDSGGDLVDPLATESSLRAVAGDLFGGWPMRSLWKRFRALFSTLSVCFERCLVCSSRSCLWRKIYEEPDRLYVSVSAAHVLARQPLTEQERPQDAGHDLAIVVVHDEAATLERVEAVVASVEV